MPFGEGYRPKPPEELFQQLETTQNTFGQDAEHSLIPESQDKEKILQMSESELKQKFARRYEMYVRLLRDKKRQEKTGESSLSPEDIAEMKKWLSILNSLDTYIKKHHKGEGITLRGKQIDVFDSMRNLLEEGGSEGYVKLPTGVGKTVLFTELVEAMDVKTLVVVPTKILVDQTAEKLEEFAPDLDFGKVYSYAKERDRQVTIITYSSLVSQLENGQIKPEDFDCLILDEVHESLSDKRKEAVGKFDKAIKLGFTATPKFSEKKQVSNLLEKEIHSMAIREAVEAGMLCSVSSIIVKTEADMSSVKVKDNGEYDEKELEKAINIVSRNKAAVDLYKKVYDGQLAVAYCVGIDHAAAVAKEFNESGVSATYISGKTPKKEQEEILERFHNGDIKVLCNADLLIAGFDEPKASVCLNLRPTQSRIDAEQRGGRVLRLDKTKPKKLATVVDFLDKNYSANKPPVLFADVAEGASFYSGKDGERSGGGVRGGDGGEVPVIIVIEGVEVIYDSEEVMKIVGAIKEDREKSGQYLTFQELKEAVKKANISTVGEYKEVYKIHQKEGWPSNPNNYYGDEWVGWPNLFGKEKVSFLSFEELKEAVKKAGVKTKREYEKESQYHSDWPSKPATFNSYSGSWEGWEKFCGTESLSLSDLKEAIKAAKIKNSTHYLAVYKNYKGWPSSPHQAYEDWPGWEKFIEKEVLNFENLKEEVFVAKVIGRREYRQEYKNHLGWPAVPEVYFKDLWRGWDDFLGKNRK